MRESPPPPHTHTVDDLTAPPSPPHTHTFTQEYVRARIRTFAKDFAREAAPELPPDAIDELTARVLAATVPAPFMLMPSGGPLLQAGQGQYRLEFRHECL